MYFFTFLCVILCDWFKSNKLLLNVSRTNYVLFHATNMLINSAQYTLKIGSEIITEKNEVKFLGIILDKNLRWNSHINHVGMKISKSLYVLNSLKRIISTPDVKSLYYTLIYPYLTNGIELWGVPKKVF